MSEQLTIADYEESFRDHRRLVRELDVIINGEAGAAKQASLCDIVGQIRELVASGGSSNYPPELYDSSEVRQHIGWLKVFIDGMTAENWRDMRLRCGRQLAELSAALNPK